MAVLSGLTSATPPARADASDPNRSSGVSGFAPVFELIDQAHRRGEISYGQTLYYRVAAIKSPELLPEAWQRALPVFGDGTKCMTPVIVDALHALPSLQKQTQTDIKNLLEPPPDFAYSVDATSPFPVRVSYRLPEQEALALSVLNAMAFAYNKVVGEMGYWVPPIEPGAQFYRVRIDETPGASGWTVPYGPVEDTDHIDYYTFIEISTDFVEHPEWVRGTVVHEFAHACQAGMDYLEPVAFWENSATYVSAMTEGYTIHYIMGSAPSFQRRPWRPLDYKRSGGSDGYEYGGCFWIYFMEHLYADNDPVWLRQVWEGCVQTLNLNLPNYFDVLDDMLQDHGGFSEMVRTFAQWRFFIGRYDDGQHLPDSFRFRDAEVPLLHEWSTSDLPVNDATPLEDVRPQPNGCNYVEVKVDTCDCHPLRFSFQGQPDLLWNVDVMRLTEDATTTYERMTIDASGAGTVTVDNGVGDRLVMVVCHITDETYEPGRSRDWIPGGYSYSIDLAAPAPTVTSVEPTFLIRGTQDATLIIHGSVFVDHTGLSVSFADPLIAVEIERFISSEQLLVRVIIRQEAGLGPRDVVVTNPGGAQGIGVGLVTILDTEPLRPEPRTYKGCMCTLGARSPAGSLTAVLLFLLFLGLLRRKN